MEEEKPLAGFEPTTVKTTENTISGRGNFYLMPSFDS